MDTYFSSCIIYILVNAVYVLHFCVHSMFFYASIHVCIHVYVTVHCTELFDISVIFMYRAFKTSVSSVFNTGGPLNKKQTNII